MRRGVPLGCGQPQGLLTRGSRLGDAETTKGVHVKMRRAASVLVAAGLLAGLAACDAVTPQWTTHSYAPSDGVNGELEKVSVRNAFLVTDGAGRASLVVGLVNTDTSPRPVQVQYTSGGTPRIATVNVPAGQLLSVGPGRQSTITLTGLTARAGSLVPIGMSSGGPFVTLQVPVLDNQLPEYRTLTPAPAPPTTPPPAP